MNFNEICVLIETPTCAPFCEWANTLLLYDGVDEASGREQLRRVVAAVLVCDG